MWESLIPAGINLLGGLFGGSSAQSAAQTQADAQVQAAKIAAEAARFKPVGVTTRFGSSNFKVDPKTGNLVSAGYTPAADIAALREQMLAQAGGQGLQNIQAAGGLTAPLQQGATGLFNLGNQYIAQSPEAAAQQWMASQQALLAPSREQAYSQMLNRNYQQGTSGLATGGTVAGGMLQSNPMAQALANAQSLQDLQLAATAQQQGRAQTEFGANLLGSGAGALKDMYGTQSAAFAPYTAGMTAATGLETLAQNPLTMGAELGGRNINTVGANALMQGYTNAAGIMGAANAQNPYASGLMSAASNKDLTNWLASLIGGSNQGGYTGMSYSSVPWEGTGSSAGPLW